MSEPPVRPLVATMVSSTEFDSSTGQSPSLSVLLSMAFLSLQLFSHPVAMAGPSSVLFVAPPRTFGPRKTMPSIAVSPRGKRMGPPQPKASMTASRSEIAGDEVGAPSKIDERTERRDDDRDAILNSMPWSDLQSWTLKDNLRRYLVSVPIPGDEGGKTRLCALWRTLAKDHIDLSGYDPKYLMAAHSLQSNEASEAEGRENNGLESTPALLPLLESFEFEANGGLSGRAYGVAGIADGTLVTTPPLTDVDLTVPKGYALTDDGDVAYELGTPAQDFYSLDGTTGAAVVAAARMIDARAKAGSSTARSLSSDVVFGQEEGDAMLVRLGGATAVLLAGAMAVNMLSHHLTVNVFWV